MNLFLGVKSCSRRVKVRSTKEPKTKKVTGFEIPAIKTRGISSDILICFSRGSESAKISNSNNKYGRCGLYERVRVHSEMTNQCMVTRIIVVLNRFNT